MPAHLVSRFAAQYRAIVEVLLQAQDTSLTGVASDEVLTRLHRHLVERVGVADGLLAADGFSAPATGPRTRQTTTTRTCPGVDRPSSERLGLLRLHEYRLAQRVVAQARCTRLPMPADGCRPTPRPGRGRTASVVRGRLDDRERTLALSLRRVHRGVGATQYLVDV